MTRFDVVLHNARQAHHRVAELVQRDEGLPAAVLSFLRLTAPGCGGRTKLSPPTAGAGTSRASATGRALVDGLVMRGAKTRPSAA